MSLKRLTAIAGCLVLAAAIHWIHGRVEAGNIDPREHLSTAHPADETSCEPSIPLRVELVPLEKPETGRVTRFQLRVDSGLDPDIISAIHVEWDMPPAVRRVAALEQGPREINRRGETRLDLRLIIPDERRHAIQARVVVRLRDGGTISQTAVRYVDLGEEDPPEGMIGRIVDADGNGIRIYQGVTVRDPQ